MNIEDDIQIIAITNGWLIVEGDETNFYNDRDKIQAIIKFWLEKTNEHSYCG